MKALRFVLAIGLLAGFASTSYAQPTTLDHLKCYRIKDPAKFSASVTLEALQTQFGLEDCTVKGKAQLFCVPIDKTVTAYTDKTKPPLGGQALIGQKLDDDRICYRIKCPKVSIPAISVSDQFGTRDVSGFVPMLLCTPAKKAYDLPDECIGQQAPQCNGLCPNPADICRPEGPIPGPCICQPPPHDLCEDTEPVCNGDCPQVLGTPPTVCRPTADGTDCSCQQPPTPCSGTAPQCNGDCPTGSKCLRTSTGKCECYDPTQCNASLPPTCGGACQIPGMVCGPRADGTGCGCSVPNQ
jgi:hypothetical protein